MSEENAITVDQILAKLNDPEALRAVMAAKGLAPQQQQQSTGKKSLEKPTIERPEDADVNAIVSALNQFLPKLDAYYEAKMDEKVGRVEESQKVDKQSAFRRQIEEFKAKVGAENFDKAIKSKILPTLFDSGTHTMEEAYAIAAKSLGLENPLEKKEKKSSTHSIPTSETKIVPQVKTSSTNVPELEKRETKPVSIRDAAAKNLEALTAEMEDGGKSLFDTGE